VRLGILAGSAFIHLRFRAREDGEKPSPPRDCKALNSRCESLFPAGQLEMAGGSGKAAPSYER